MASKALVLFGVCYLIATVGLTLDSSDRLKVRLSVEQEDLEAASMDFGGMSRARPMGVMVPEDARDVARVVRAAYNSVAGFHVSARGNGHSVNGQALTSDGVVVEMLTSPRRGTAERISISSEGMYVDAWGGELWIDVLKATLKHGLAPRSWTDYLYLTVGGTLSNAGISGQAFSHGPQISNVHELDVVTGKGELVTCSETQNPDLFHAVLGGLGQFGIITRARIRLQPAPKRVRWIRILYSDISVFTKDQEFLISLNGSDKFDYVEGFVIADGGLINNWRSSFFSPQYPLNISSTGVLYCIEVTKNYNDDDDDPGQLGSFFNRLSFIPGSIFSNDLTYIDFLDRVHTSELKLRSKGLWDVPHPWLNLFVPKSRIADFDEGVFKGILGKKTSGPVLIYPLNKNKWDNRTSVVTPNEDVFYLVAFLRSALQSGELAHSLEYLSDENRRILRFCDVAGIGVKRYLPYYSTREEWRKHFGERWDEFRRRKMEYDPRRLLATGQRIFRPGSVSKMELY